MIGSGGHRKRDPQASGGGALKWIRFFPMAVACIEAGQGAELRIRVVSLIRTDTDSLQLFLRIPLSEGYTQRL
jgi:hypothetical protein